MPGGDEHWFHGLAESGIVLGWKIELTLIRSILIRFNGEELAHFTNHTLKHRIST